MRLNKIQVLEQREDVWENIQDIESQVFRELNPRMSPSESRQRGILRDQLAHRGDRNFPILLRKKTTYDIKKKKIEISSSIMLCDALFMFAS